MKMNKTASPNHHWVWTEIGSKHWDEIRQGQHEPRKADTPVYDHYRYTVPKSWVEQGYVREAPIEGQLSLF
jgi:hypothetical protein